MSDSAHFSQALIQQVAEKDVAQALEPQIDRNLITFSILVTDFSRLRAHYLITAGIARLQKLFPTVSATRSRLIAAIIPETGPPQN